LVDGATVLYIGKASGGAHGRRGLRKRLDEYRRQGRGEPAGHWGGRYIWQLRDHADLLVAWKATPGEDPENVGSRLISDYIDTYGSRPFANRKVGRLMGLGSAETIKLTSDTEVTPQPVGIAIGYINLR
jgi:hypothetical protein